MKEIRLNDPLHPEGGPIFKVKYDEDCVFCKHCTDIFWDYTHGPYMLFCEDDHDVSQRPCPYFEEDKENDTKTTV